MRIKSLFLLFSLLATALLIGLGERPVYKIQEVRIAETAREMLVDHDWMVPHYNGDLRLQKPPLPYWLTAASYKIGGVNATTTRLPAVLSGLLLALLIWNWVRRESSPEIAANSVLMLVASYIGLRYFRSGEADAPLLFFISAASMLGYNLLFSRQDTRQRLLFGLALGLGFLSKGPAALAIPLLTLLAMAAMEKRAGRLQPSVKQFFSLPSIVLLLVVAFGWYIWIVWQLPDVARHFFGQQVDETFISGTHAKPVWWYLAHLPEFFAPWGILLVPAAWMAYRQRHNATIPALVRFAWAWLAVVLVLLTATVNKQMQYALLFAPPLAIILGHYLAEAKDGFARVNRILFWLFCITALSGVAVALSKSPGISHAVFWLALPLAPLILQRLLRNNEISVPVLLVAGMTTMIYLYSEAYLSKEPRKTAAQTLMIEAAKHSPLYQPRTGLNDGTLSFYAERVVPPIDATEIMALLQQQPEIWMVGENIPTLPGVTVKTVAQTDEMKLYRLQRKPPANLENMPASNS